MNLGKSIFRKSNIILIFVCVIIIAFLAIDNMVAQESEEPDKNAMNVKLFYLSPDGNSYISEDREITKYGAITDQVKTVLMELIRGPETNLSPTIPQGTDVKEVFIDGKKCAYIDFNRSISQNHIGGTTAELATIASIVNTLTANFPKEIQKVRILIDGKEVRTLAGHIDITKPIFPF